MKIKLRLILSLILVVSIGFYFLFDFVVKDIRPRYLESVEESINDTAHILASLVETEIKNNSMHFSTLRKVFDKTSQKRFSSKIYQLTKTNVNLNIYVVNHNGIVLYDSSNPENIGKDYSQWNDVILVFRGEYGARASLTDPNDPTTSALFVAAPIKHNEKLIGAITVVKPKDSVTPFIELAKKKFNLILILIFLVIIVMSIVITIWITRPITKLINYVNAVKNNRKAAMPKLGKTEIKDLSIAFEQLREELEGKKYIENYVHSLTHEIKSPLSSISGAAELLNEKLPEDQKSKYYNNIKSETKRIENIINKLLDLSEIESRKELKDITIINLFELCGDIITSLKPQINRKSLTIDNSIDKNFIIKGEKFLLRHVILNLIQNAINFSLNKGKVKIQSEQTENHICIFISDEGSGIPDYAKDKIFDRFYSLPPQGTNQKSTGLGLPFVKEAVLLHNGTIDIENNTGPGVTASIKLPK